MRSELSKSVIDRPIPVLDRLSAPAHVFMAWAALVLGTLAILYATLAGGTGSLAVKGTYIAFGWILQCSGGWLLIRRWRQGMLERALDQRHDELADLLGSLQENPLGSDEAQVALDLALQKKAEHDARLFQRNRSSTFELRTLVLEGLEFFDDLEWELRPRINILLGRNGYGKSHLLRGMLALLQDDDERLSTVARPRTTARERCAELVVSRNGSEEPIVYGRHLAGIGKVPVLAIPDTRFIDKAVTEVEATSSKEVDPVEHGARQFLEDRPFGPTIEAFLGRIALDYVTKRKRFKLPIFELIVDVVRRLTDGSFEFDEIRRIGQTRRFRIDVITEGNENHPLPIQKASQGTLSVIAMFGLIFDFLRQLHPRIPERKVTEQPGLVFIDEIDAHLHPTWQQRIVGLLREKFPRVQFVLTAHSPLVVAGCLDSEVSVLRKNEDRRFELHQYLGDFIGVKPEEIYHRVLEIDEGDDGYNRYTALAPFESEISAEVEDLKAKSRSPQEELRLKKLRDDLYYIDKARSRQEKTLNNQQLHRENRVLRRRLSQIERANQEVST